MKHWFLSKKARSDVSRETSGEEHINILDGKRVVQREIDRVADKPGAVAHAGVDIPRRDEKLRILRKIDLRIYGDDPSSPHGAYLYDSGAM